MSVTSRWAAAALGVVALSVPAAVQAAKAPVSHVERSLAGVRLGTRATTLIKQIGQPTEIQLGAGAAAAGGGGLEGGGFGAAAENPFGAAMPAPPPMPGGLPMPGGPPMPGGAPMPGASPFPGALPPVSGGNPFGPSPAGGDMGGADQGAGSLAVTYVYRNFKGHKGFDFVVQIDEDGRVVQLVGTSLRPVPGIYTSRGVGFGSTYSTVLNKYGWPQAHTAAGNFIQTSFQDTAHVAFQFLNGRVVRIVVAEVG